jgi:hypothetical protein
MSILAGPTRFELAISAVTAQRGQPLPYGPRLSPPTHQLHVHSDANASELCPALFEIRQDFSGRLADSPTGYRSGFDDDCVANDQAEAGPRKFDLYEIFDAGRLHGQQPSSPQCIDPAFWDFWDS